jgi:glycosyltransferase involved in cell wall biosynthesis
MRVLGWIERFGYTRADVVVGTMPNLVEHVMDEVGEGASVATVPLGIDDDLAELTQRYEPAPKSGENILIGYSGSIGRSNSVEALLSAAKQLGPDQGIEFEFWGGGDLLEDFREQYSGQPHIQFHGHTPRQVLFSELARTHMLVLATNGSSRWKYGQSLNKLVEYMLVGRPIIAVYSGFPSMINESECGIFVPVEDLSALVEAILHYRDMSGPEREEIGLRGRAWIQRNRSYDRLARKYLDIFDTL